jgi:hypothetical protein
MSGLYTCKARWPEGHTCRPDPDEPDYYEIVAPDGSVIDRLNNFHEVEKALSRLNRLKKAKENRLD